MLYFFKIKAKKIKTDYYINLISFFDIDKLYRKIGITN